MSEHRRYLNSLPALRKAAMQRLNRVSLPPNDPRFVEAYRSFISASRSVTEHANAAGIEPEQEAADRRRMYSNRPRPGNT